MKSTLNRIAEIVKEYKQTDVLDGNNLNKQLKRDRPLEKIQKPRPLLVWIETT